MATRLLKNGPCRMKTTRPTISARMNHALERFLPERRVFIRSEQENTFCSPATAYTIGRACGWWGGGDLVDFGNGAGIYGSHWRRL